MATLPACALAPFQPENPRASAPATATKETNGFRMGDLLGRGFRAEHAEWARRVPVLNYGIHWRRHRAAVPPPRAARSLLHTLRALLQRRGRRESRDPRPARADALCRRLRQGGGRSPRPEPGTGVSRGPFDGPQSARQSSLTVTRGSLAP